MDLKQLYEEKNYKKLFILPLIILVISIYFIFQIQLGIDLAGGTRITVVTNGNVDINELKSAVTSQYSLKDLTIRQTTGLNSRVYLEFVEETRLTELKNSGNQEEYIKARENFKNNILDIITSTLKVSEESITFEEVGASTGAIFWEQGRNAIIIGFILISIVVFIFFRKIIISLAVLQSTIFDVAMGLGAIGLFGIPLSLASIAPLLMLIGYSINTDIMLTERVMKRREGGTTAERISGAFLTGMTMTGTTIGAMTVLFVISYLANIEVLINMSLILLVGLFGDIIATWCTNAGMLVWTQKK